jgi:hypothetical protein
MSVVPESHAPKSQDELPPSTEAPAPPAADLDAQAAVPGPSRRQTLVYAVGAALFAGFLAWGMARRRLIISKSPGRPKAGTTSWR